MEQTKIAVFEGAPLAKSDQAMVAQRIIDLVLGGEVDPLRLDVTLKSIEETISAIRKNADVKRLTLAEASKYVGKTKTFDAFGATITPSSRKTWDFAACGDVVWDGLKDQENEIVSKRKSREKLLVAITEGQDIVDASTGAVIEPPPCKASEYLTIKFK